MNVKQCSKKEKKSKAVLGQKSERKTRVGTSVVEIPLTISLTPSQPLIHFLVSFFSSQTFCCFIRNCAQLKNTVDLLQAQVDWSFHLNTIAIETEGENKKQTRKQKQKMVRDLSAECRSLLNKSPTKLAACVCREEPYLDGQVWWRPWLGSFDLTEQPAKPVKWRRRKPSWSFKKKE
jgi:hypothetical protein